MDTNSINQLTGGNVATTFNAWHLVALGVGAAVVHIYHTVVNAGGLKKIIRNFINGPEGIKGN